MVEIDISKDGESNTCEGRRGREGLEGGTAGAGNDWSLWLCITISVTSPVGYVLHSYIVLPGDKFSVWIVGGFMANMSV